MIIMGARGAPNDPRRCPSGYIQYLYLRHIRELFSTSIIGFFIYRKSLVVNEKIEIINRYINFVVLLVCMCHRVRFPRKWRSDERGGRLLTLNLKWIVTFSVCMRIDVRTSTRHRYVPRRGSTFPPSHSHSVASASAVRPFVVCIKEIQYLSTW